MAMKKQYRMTKEGTEELSKELVLRVAARTQIADRIKTAREFGDLTENAEYSSAMNEKEQNESRIAELEHILGNVELITAPKSDSKVRLGSSVILKSEDGKQVKFSVVGTVEADPLEGKISDESPIGNALLGKKIGDNVEIQTPAETRTYKLVEIS
jgi:transcription elongation factor GreA